MTLTIHEIKDLAECAGLVLDPERPPLDDLDDLDTEITISECPEHGIDEDGTRRHYKFIAYFTEYPEEGSYGLGNAT